MNKTMGKTMIFTVQVPDNGKPIVYAQMTTDNCLKDQHLTEELIREWIKGCDEVEATDQDIEDLAYSVRKEGYAWWDETYCFELSEIYG